MDQGKMKSQRGVGQSIFVKNLIIWPQNHVLGGQSKTRLSYDNLSWSQWVAEFASIIREKSDLDSKM